MKDEALIPMRLFRSRVFSIGLSVNVLVGLGMFGALSTLPLYLQLVKGATPTESGLLLLPMMLGIMAGSILSGQLTSRTGKYKIFPVIGTALLAITFFLMLTVTVDTPYWQLDIYFLMIGAGLGLCMQTMLIAVQNTVPGQGHGCRHLDRRPSSVSSVARWVSRSSCRCCSTPCRTRSRARCSRPAPLPRSSRPSARPRPIRTARATLWRRT